jgi:hypothetical protein
MTGIVSQVKSRFFVLRPVSSLNTPLHGEQNIRARLIAVNQISFFFPVASEAVCTGIKSCFIILTIKSTMVLCCEGQATPKREADRDRRPPAGAAPDPKYTVQ